MKANTTQKENLLVKSLQPNATFTKDQVMDVIHWLRQIIGVVIGIVWGVLPLTGLVGILGYAVLSTLIVYTYLFIYLKNIDEQIYGETYFPLLQEAFFPAFAVFCVLYLLYFSYHLYNIFYSSLGSQLIRYSMLENKESKKTKFQKNVSHFVPF